MRNFTNEDQAVRDDLAQDYCRNWELDAGTDAAAFRSAMRKVVGGVTVITTVHEDRPWGMTVSAFTPVCMDPPTLLVCVNRETVTASCITKLQRFAVNVLSQDQLAISQFCSRPREDKFVEEFAVPQSDYPDRILMPVLKDSLITLDCIATATLVVNSHLVVMGRVTSVLAPTAKKPLLYGEGQYMHGVSLQMAVA
ncbi:MULTISPECIES: flavin reductase family protein [unclassified Sinorhizobium]|uniref:flavin reductase family protein n=1 Tax=unclassified Sinorhizobium TaxID=2613772 RepID=UPI0024C2C6B3|nr:MULTISPECIES: flavin reductase family protein [unclassified Sinorhizobium]MDK1376823.1 flavin reductase family protein [Sinorhizobium sp. 6-70]MDK1481076.1 flavin reductase family protein [Sinorhizobium sp. 6-117]